MKFRIHAQMLTETRQWAARWIRSPVLGMLRSTVAWLLAVPAYLGLLIAPFVLLGTLFKAMHDLEMVGRQYWAFAGIPFLAAVWYGRRLVRRIWHFHMQSVIDVDGIVALIAVALALAVSLWLFPPH